VQYSVFLTLKHSITTQQTSQHWTWHYVWDGSTHLLNGYRSCWSNRGVTVNNCPHLASYEQILIKCVHRWVMKWVSMSPVSHLDQMHLQHNELANKYIQNDTLGM